MKKITALLLIVCLLAGVPFAAAAAEHPVGAITTSGFTISNFTGENNYYLCYPTDWNNCKITAVSPAEASVSIQVEQYCGYKKNYTLGQVLDLGYGRARVTVSVTLNGATYSYLLALTDPRQDTYYYAYPNESFKIRKTPSASGEVLTTYTKTSAVFCVETRGGWSHVVTVSGGSSKSIDGWVESSKIKRSFNTTNISPALTEKVAALQRKYPNWHFEYLNMGQSLDAYTDLVSGQTVSNMAGGGTGKDQIKYYMDPANFLDEKNVFMFLDVSRYNKETFTEQGVSAMWAEKDNAVCDKATAISYLLSAGESLRANTYFIAARAALESGHGTSQLAKGTVSGYEGYYNFFGIGAVDSNPLQGGASYAKNRGWDSVAKSITEGANWLIDQYVQRGQYTPYFLRFFPLQGREWHIYMSDIAAPKSDAANLYKQYQTADTLNKDLYFVIPIYDFRYYDVPADAWYTDEVYKATDYGIFSGMGNGYFNPEQKFTRAEFVTVLAKMSGADTTTQTTTAFSDVAADKWYYRNIAWAYNNNIVAGLGNGRFAPGQSITRQEMCKMISNYAHYRQIPLTGKPLSFTDRDKIADWAKSAVEECYATGIISGMPGNKFEPTGIATRAQGARVMTLFYENFVK